MNTDQHMKKISRKDFLHQTSLAGLGLTVPGLMSAVTANSPDIEFGLVTD